MAHEDVPTNAHGWQVMALAGKSAVKTIRRLLVKESTGSLI
jgi:hypothetical protein